MLAAASSSSPNPASGQAHGNCSAATSARAAGGGPRTHACRGWDIISLSEIQMFPCHRSVSNNEVRRLALPWDDGEGISSRRWSGDYGRSQICSSSTYTGAESNLDRRRLDFVFRLAPRRRFSRISGTYAFDHVFQALSCLCLCSCVCDATCCRAVMQCNATQRNATEPGLLARMKGKKFVQTRCKHHLLQPLTSTT